MHDPFPLLEMSGEQISLLTAQLLVYQHYLQKKVASSVKRNRTLRVLLALLQRLNALFNPGTTQRALLLTVEEVAVIKEALRVLQHVLKTKPPSVGRDQEMQRLAAMRARIEQTFPLTQD